MGSTGSMKTSSVPPHTNPVSYFGLLFRLKVSVRGFSCCITSRAACHTSASTHPPPMVPTMEPSSRTSIFAVLKEGIDPRTLMIVASAARRPLRRRLTISSYRSMCRLWATAEGKSKGAGFNCQMQFLQDEVCPGPHGGPGKFDDLVTAVAVNLPQHLCRPDGFVEVLLTFLIGC